MEPARDVARFEDVGVGRHPDPAQVVLAGPAAVVIEPAPRLIADPGIAYGVIPAPAALMEGGPTVDDPGPPDGADMSVVSQSPAASRSQAP